MEENRVCFIYPALKNYEKLRKKNGTNEARKKVKGQLTPDFQIWSEHYLARALTRPISCPRPLQVSNFSSYCNFRTRFKGRVSSRGVRFWDFFPCCCCCCFFFCFSQFPWNYCILYRIFSIFLIFLIIIFLSFILVYYYYYYYYYHYYYYFISAISYLNIIVLYCFIVVQWNPVDTFTKRPKNVWPY